MGHTMLQTASEVIDAMGGTMKVAILTKRKPQAISNWRATNRLPPTTFLLITTELSRLGLSADQKLWGMEE